MSPSQDIRNSRHDHMAESGDGFTLNEVRKEYSRCSERDRSDSRRLSCSLTPAFEFVRILIIIMIMKKLIKREQKRISKTTLKSSQKSTQK